MGPILCLRDASDDVMVDNSHCRDQQAPKPDVVDNPHPNNPKVFSTSMFRLYSVLLLGYLCIVLQGYDGSLMGAINAMVCRESLSQVFNYSFY